MVSYLDLRKRLDIDFRSQFLIRNHGKLIQFLFDHLAHVAADIHGCQHHRPGSHHADIADSRLYFFQQLARHSRVQRKIRTTRGLPDRTAHRVLHRRIRGRYNALDAAIAGSEPARFLDAYGEITSAESSKFTNVLRNMLKHYKLEEINGQLDRTKKALGDDLRADQSSGEKAHLSEILDNLSSMHLSTSFLMMVDEFEEKLAGAAAKAKVAVPPVNGTMMILGLLDVIDSGSSQPSQFETLLAKLGLDKNVWTEIFTLQGIKEILRTMPDRIYDSIRGLAKLQEAAQAVLESAILREEAAAPAA
jgi:hypothetical protein